jgi:arylsulfatase A-like enzyme
MRPLVKFGHQRHLRIDDPVELRDVLPTLLDAAGAPIPTTIEGKSLLQLARSEGGWREYIDLEHDICYGPENHWNGLTDGKWKYIYQIAQRSRVHGRRIAARKHQTQVDRIGDDAFIQKLKNRSGECTQLMRALRFPREGFQHAF